MCTLSHRPVLACCPSGETLIIIYLSIYLLYARESAQLNINALTSSLAGQTHSLLVSTVVSNRALSEIKDDNLAAWKCTVINIPYSGKFSQVKIFALTSDDN